MAKIRFPIKVQQTFTKTIGWAEAETREDAILLGFKMIEDKDFSNVASDKSTRSDVTLDETAINAEFTYTELLKHGQL